MKNDEANLTIILNIWKRNYLAEQIEALYSQTVLPKHIWIIQQENFIAVDQVLSEFPDIKYFKSPCNLKYFFRYSLAQHCDTK